MPRSVRSRNLIVLLRIIFFGLRDLRLARHAGERTDQSEVGRYSSYAHALPDLFGCLLTGSQVHHHIPFSLTIGKLDRSATSTSRPYRVSAKLAFEDAAAHSLSMNLAGWTCRSAPPMPRFTALCDRTSSSPIARPFAGWPGPGIRSRVRVRHPLVAACRFRSRRE
mgnify:CR=1 FL=1